ncbi:MAG: hypothetical protein COA63_012540 [Methylophaga sp.]|nr:hypothetical protein [Methylophaga sp.]
MTKLTKALLLSAFVYPGAGQIFLKRSTSGIIFIIISTMGLYFILSNIFKITFQIIEDIKSGGVQPDFTTLLSLISQHDTQLLNNAFTVMIVTWLISIIHIFIVSKTSQ